MRRQTKWWLLTGVAVLALLAGIGIGSAAVPLHQISAILANQLLGTPLPQGLSPVLPGLVMNIRLPRVLLAFLVGAALALGGTVMQSVLKNPLASPFGLGVSAGAGLGAALVIAGGFSGGVLGALLLPGAGLLLGLGTMVAAVTLAGRIDRTLSNNTIILTGMVLSLFLNAIMTMLATSNPQHTQRILLWQMGSLSMKEWRYVWILLMVLLPCMLLFLRRSRELDIMTFGEEQAAALGLELKRTKWVLISTVAVLTGTAVAFVGIIGFVDLIVPHLARRIFGASHRVVLPAAALMGGAFLVVCDLFARTLVSPSEIPIGSITALLGAPFFLYIYFASRKRG